MNSNETRTFGDWTLTVVVGDPPFYENGFLISHDPSGDTAAVDPGCAATKFTNPVALAGGKLTQILLTHGHPDHVSGVAELQRVIKGPCHVHADEKPVIEVGSALAGSFGMSGFESPSDCTWFDDNPTLTIGGQPVGVINSPGHTPGGVVFVFPGFALTGDTLFAQGVGRTDLPGGDGATLGRSIDKVLKELPGDTVMYSGHGPSWTVDEARPWWTWAKDAYGLG
ncbi:MBL fold metallo-hydrolase [Magnetospira sp. QH-2]|uniref:MBL fold metallo-hydrolase n=1 Tax=Magnetospira sp. (strain QH-2) TaxID=1288970 RepID=UPI0003E80D92|nr:MBL fold metallo-hydrolase [Magnetospira sp. QH-2]CCQ73160.1 Putative metallo-beta-lactamase family protein [Magnetospira sp. QH-2]